MSGTNSGTGHVAGQLWSANTRPGNSTFPSRRGRDPLRCGRPVDGAPTAPAVPTGRPHRRARPMGAPVSPLAAWSTLHRRRRTHRRRSTPRGEEEIDGSGNLPRAPDPAGGVCDHIAARRRPVRSTCDHETGARRATGGAVSPEGTARGSMGPGEADKRHIHRKRPMGRSGRRVDRRTFPRPPHRCVTDQPIRSARRSTWPGSVP